MMDLKDVNDDSILVFEYFTAAGVEDLSIVSEAVELIRSLVSDLKDEDIYVLLAKQFENIFDDLDFDVKKIDLEDQLFDILSITEGEDFEAKSNSRLKNSYKNSKRKVEEMDEALKFLDEISPDKKHFMTKAARNKFNLY